MHVNINKTGSGYVFELFVVFYVAKKVIFLSYMFGGIDLMKMCV